ncbi:valine--tRNA ligase [Candidatus Saganbacteria bacterium]|nr:valine--tRNA ligase [Candidatus Saganbacteria bacterium]
MTELSKTYDPQKVEQKWYKFWEENGLFKPNTKAEVPFTIVIPPPNVTGSLHMGHALDNSIQDVLIRYKRMKGFKTLWIPGTDHAGIATQNVVERELKKEGKRKEDLGREKFLKKVWEWKKEYGSRITSQLRRLGASCDWSHERFTMDEGLSRAVKKQFVQLYSEGLIYRGKRIINWCPRCKTALSDIEVEYENKKGSLWFIKYGPITVATTRPETILGDTAIAVSPKDDRYKHLWGQTVELPLVGRKIPIIKDDLVELEFGTGAVKVTPAHDPNDYEMGERHNLPKINILTPDGKITLKEFTEEREKQGLAGLEGLDRFKAREKIVEMLKENGYLEKIEDYQNSVGQCYRCKTVIEPYLSDQWFVKVKPLAEAAIAVVEESKIKFVPDRWTKVYLQWMTNLRDWCVSRQLWWGHQIPAWYCGGMTNDKLQMTNGCSEIIVSETKPDKCPKCGGTNLVQDQDVFDTWFSSALWPFSTLGWPDETEDLKTHYPTSVLVTGYDIITFWVSRMIMQGVHFMGKAPFHTVFIHGLIRDITGKKMSKSLGNVIDPIDIIDHAGADALRFALISLVSGGGQDIKLAEEKITEARNFSNKIWNVARFAALNSPPLSPSLNKRGGNPTQKGGGELADQWILSRYNRTIKQVSEYIDNLQVGDAAKLLYEFIWSEFCDWYIEISKIRLYGTDENAKATVQSVLSYILEGTLKLLHPFMPFETEELYQQITSSNKHPTSNIQHPTSNEMPDPKDSIMVQKYPESNEKLINGDIEKQMDLVFEFIRTIRNLRSTFNIVPGVKIKVFIEKELGATTQSYIKTLAKIAEFEISNAYPKHSIISKVEDIEFAIPIEGLVDFAKESERLKKEYNKLAVEIEKVKTRLNDENFKKNTTEGSIAKENQKLKEYGERIGHLESYVSTLQ